MASQPSASGRSRPQSDAMSQWTVGSKIGKGSFASVYVGTHKVSASPRLLWLSSLAASQKSQRFLVL